METTVNKGYKTILEHLKANGINIDAFTPSEEQEQLAAAAKAVNAFLASEEFESIPAGVVIEGAMIGLTAAIASSFTRGVLEGDNKVTEYPEVCMLLAECFSRMLEQTSMAMPTMIRIAKLTGEK